MANLKIILNNKIEPRGYIDVTKSIVMDPQGFKDFDNAGGGWTKERTRLLLDVISHGTLQQLDANGAPEDVTENNCGIRAVPDQRPSPGNRSKVTVPMPENVLSNADLAYLDDYVAMFLELRKPGTTLPVPNAPADADKARQFLMGVLMLTRCR